MRRTYVFTPKYEYEEKKSRYFDFSNVLLEGETVASASVTGVNATISGTAFNDTTVSFDVSGGTAGTTCVISCYAVGSLGSKLEAQGTMYIQAEV